MFSGIIERVGDVQSVSLRDRAMDVRIATHFTDLTEGESIATNGVCLTVTRFTPEGVADFHLSGETLARTALGDLVEGARVNLERAVSLNTRLSGHIVQGHVDAVGRLTYAAEAGESHHLRVFMPASLRRYVIEKGSITINGISLTVNEVHDDASHDGQEGFEISLMIIPHTWTHTDLSTLAIGAKVNLEVDMMAKYVETLLRHTPEEELRYRGDAR